jgi:nucleoporin NUP159
LPGKSSLLAVGNKKGWLAAAVRKEDGSNCAYLHILPLHGAHKLGIDILMSSLGDLRTVFESGKPDPDPFIPFAPQHALLSVPGTPVILKFALNDERLLIGFLEGPILVYNTSDLCTSTGSSQVRETHLRRHG